MRGIAFGLLVLYFPTFAGAQGFGSLKTVRPRAVPGLDRYVRDSKALVVLGKALFWDMQVGSDGRTACATCHFHAGADHRTNGVSTADFPFRVFADPEDNASAIVRDSSRRLGSAGVVRRVFQGLTGSAEEAGRDAAGAGSARQMTGRNTPTVINSVFHVRSFLDGRASDIFTGLTPFGASDPRANAVADGMPETVRLPHSALASQAVAPPVNAVEMSYEGRTWADLARKLLPAHPLDGQAVAIDDSVLGPYVDACCRGLAPGLTYSTLLQAAFQPAYAEAAEVNFPLLFGLALQAYQTTLVADDSRFDRFLEGQRDALAQREKSGFLVFQTKAFCQFCHSGPEMTTATFTFTASHGSVDEVLSGGVGKTQVLFADTGFFRTGVRPAEEDPGLGGFDDFGVPVSLAARSGAAPLGILGAFKIPGLRNVELTGPYFHNGGQATLEQVVEFYRRGGDFPDSPGLASHIAPTPMSAADRADLVTFLKSMTDDRVRFERAPFDHPELCVPEGDRWVGVPAVGRGGNAVPLQTFEELLKGVGADGSRAHAMTGACGIP
jgi:cytochrome c peroxidase